MSTSGATCSWRSLQKMSDGSLVELAVSLKFLFFPAPYLHLYQHFFFQPSWQISHLHLQFFHQGIDVALSHNLYNCHCILLLPCQHYHFFLDCDLGKLFFHNWFLPFYRVYCKGWICIYISIDFPQLYRSLLHAFDLATFVAIFNLYDCCSKLCLFSVNSASAINSAILVFSSSDLSSLEDLWLESHDCLLLHLD